LEEKMNQMANVLRGDLVEDISIDGQMLEEILAQIRSLPMDIELRRETTIFRSDLRFGSREKRTGEM
jgi:hypothetical protein